MPSIYNSIIDNLIIRNTLTLEESVYALQTKETKLNDLGSIKEESANFAAQESFYRCWRDQKGQKVGASTVLQTVNRGYTV